MTKKPGKHAKPIVIPPRYLHRDPARNYTHEHHNALPDEPEVIDNTTLERLATENLHRYAITHADQLLRDEAKSIARRLREAILTTSRAGHNITPELDTIRRQLEAIEDKRQAA